MPPKPSQPFSATQSDAELEWLLCLAAALQTHQREFSKPTVERLPPPGPSFLRGLQTLLKGLRRPERTRAA